MARQVRDRVTDTELRAAAVREWPPEHDPYQLVAHLADLVDATREWVADLNAYRRTRGRKPLLPVSPPPEPPQDPARLVMTGPAYLAAYWSPRRDTSKQTAAVIASDRDGHSWVANPEPVSTRATDIEHATAIPRTNSR